MGGRRLRVAAVIAVGLGWAVACGPDDGLDPGPIVSATEDGGVEPIPSFPFDAGDADRFDAGTSDGGDTADGGTDGGEDTFDGGTDGGGDTFDGGTVTLPSSAGWTFYGPQHGGPRTVFGVSMDSSGNVWVAGGADGLFLLEPGASTFRRFTHQEGLAAYDGPNGRTGFDVISVAGATADTVFVGYQGVHGGKDDNDPEWMVKSGDADRVKLTSAGTLDVRHFDIASAAGTIPSYPDRRDKIRDVFRIVYDRTSGDAWFGGNHGIAMYDAKRDQVWEHEHASINGYTNSGAYTLLSGDWYGIALDPDGNAWMGGGHRVARLNFATEGRQFFASQSPVIDVWPDAQTVDARPEQRTDDFVQDLAVTRGGTVWVGSIPNGLARISSSGTSFVKSGLVDPKVTALEVDPLDGSLWVGHIWGGISRIKDGSIAHYDDRVFGDELIAGLVPDIQSTEVGGKRRILAAFSSGAIGIYDGD